MEKYEETLSGTDVINIASLIGTDNVKNFNKYYNFLCGRFAYLPLEFTNKREIDFVNKNPCLANADFNVHIDGSAGDDTAKTPEKLLDIYVRVWDKILDYEKKIVPKKRGRQPYVQGLRYKYNLKWKEKTKIKGRVGGDVIISFPKFDLEKQDVSERSKKLMARLVYTLGNFMPVPFIDRSKSLNIIHGHCKNGKGFQLERMDCFLLDLKDPNSQYKDIYSELLGEYYSFDKFAEVFYLKSFLDDNNEVFDLSQSCTKLKQSCKTKDKLQMLNNENLENYIINGCACIISRGNELLKKLEQ